MGNKIDFDIEKSLELNPPNYDPRLVRYVKRIPVSHKRIEVDYSKQPRATNTVSPKELEELKDSFERGFRYEEPVIVVVRKKNKKGEYEFSLARGYNRYRVLVNRLSWDTLLVDVVEPHDEKCEFYFRHDNRYRAPQNDATAEDIAVYIQKGINSGDIGDTQVDIDQAIALLMPKDTHQKVTGVKRRLERLRSRDISNMEVYDKKSAHTLAEKIGIPYDGSKGKAPGLGLIVGDDFATKFDQMVKLSMSNPRAKIQIYAYIENPNADVQVFQGQRETWTNTLRDRWETPIRHLTAYYKDEDESVMEKGRLPYVFCGFLPQDTENDDFENPVDSKGKPFIR